MSLVERLVCRVLHPQIVVALGHWQRENERLVQQVNREMGCNLPFVYCCYNYAQQPLLVDVAASARNSIPACR